MSAHGQARTGTSPSGPVQDMLSGEVFAPSEPVPVMYQGTAYLIRAVPAGVMIQALSSAHALPPGDAGTEIKFLAAAVTRNGTPVDRIWLQSLPWRVFSRWLQIAQEVNCLDAGVPKFT